MSQWIKCSDKLPSDELDGFQVIVAVTNSKRMRITECDVWKMGRQKGRFDFWGNKVTHWQPLPAPPEVEP